MVSLPDLDKVLLTQKTQLPFLKNMNVIKSILLQRLLVASFIIKKGMTILIELFMVKILLFKIQEMSIKKFLETIFLLVKLVREALILNRGGYYFVP